MVVSRSWTFEQSDDGLTGKFGFRNTLIDDEKESLMLSWVAVSNVSQMKVCKLRIFCAMAVAVSISSHICGDDWKSKSTVNTYTCAFCPMQNSEKTLPLVNFSRRVCCRV
jgi:hypothetical protein